jgi:hypothetical protein
MVTMKKKKKDLSQTQGDKLEKTAARAPKPTDAHHVRHHHRKLFSVTIRRKTVTMQFSMQLEEE